MNLPNYPLFNVHLEFLKLFATDTSEEDLQEPKDQLAQFYARKSVGKANDAWQEKGLTQEVMDRWVDEE